MKRTLFYFAPVATDRLNELHKQDLHIGPADNKVFSVCRALRANGCDAVVVSALLNRRSGMPAAQALRAERVPFVRINSFGRGLAKRFVSSISFLIFCIRKVKGADRVLFYNFFPEYILAALYLKIVGNPGIIDVEDGPRADERGPRGAMVRSSYKIMHRLTARKYITVSSRLSRSLGLDRFRAIYGVANSKRTVNLNFSPFSSDRINVLYGGAILPDTGLDLFVECVDHILECYPDAPITFNISGNYDYDLMSALAQKVEKKAGKVAMICHRGLSLSDYKKMLESMDAGLCLKLASREMGQTTFPSKVVEYSSLGILVISTCVSDVPDIFDDSSAIMLPHENPTSLAEALVSMANDRTGSRERARSGQVVAENRFSAKAVSTSIEELVFG